MNAPDPGDTSLQALEDRLGARMQGLETRMQGLETRMQGLEDRMQGLEDRFEARMQAMEERFDARNKELEDRLVQFMAREFEAFRRDIGALERRVGFLGDVTASLVKQNSTIESELGHIRGTQAGQQQAIEDLYRRMQKLEQRNSPPQKT